MEQKKYPEEALYWFRETGRLGGIRRMMGTTKAERSALGKLAAEGRWAKYREQQKDKKTA